MHGQVRIRRVAQWGAGALVAALLASFMFATMTAEAQTGTATPTATATASPTATGTGTPAPPSTGNAGLAGDAEGSSAPMMLLLVGGLVVGTAVAVAGARALSQKSR